MERLAAHGSYDTLTAAIQAAGMVELLDGPGTFTVFAPTDDAFAALPPGTVESLLQPARRDELVALLSHHVVVAELGSAQLAGKVQVIDTYYGATGIEIDGLDGRLAVDGVPIVDPGQPRLQRPDPRHRRRAAAVRRPPARGARRLRLSRPRCLTPARPGPNFRPDRLAQSVEAADF